MPYDPTRHRRRSIRLRHYDYASPGAYFVTICVQHRACLLGEVDGGQVRLSEAGRLVHAAWDDLPRPYPHLALDAFVVMPNHVHGILCIHDGPDGPDGANVTDDANITDGTNVVGGRNVGAPLVGALGAPSSVSPPHERAGTRPAPTPDRNPWNRTHTLDAIVGAFKSRTTNGYIQGVRSQGWPPFDRRLWQRSYWERVLRDERELDLARRYIHDNPLRWHLDRMHPERLMR